MSMAHNLTHALSHALSIRHLALLFTGCSDEFDGVPPSGGGDNHAQFNTYLGQNPPGDTPEIFAPNLLSLPERHERILAFSPDLKEIYFSAGPINKTTIMYFKHEDGVWQGAVEAPFLTNHSFTSAMEPSLSPDGNTLLFSSAMNKGGNWTVNVWKTERAGGTWQEPEMLSSAINSNEEEWHPTVAANKNIYFARYNGSTANLYFSEHLGNDHYADSIALNAINSSSEDYDPYIDPKERFLIFKSNRSGGAGNFDLYISYKNNGYSWSRPTQLNTVNTPQEEDMGSLTPDGKYFFFSRPASNGNMDIYWVDTRSIGISFYSP